MSGTLINSRQEEIIHKLQKKSKRKANNFLSFRSYSSISGSSGVAVQKKNNNDERTSYHSNLVPSNYK